MQREELIGRLSSKSARKRLKAVKKLKKREKEAPVKSGVGTLSVHTDYSFSPFTPSLAAYLAYRGGLSFAGICDHDSLAGAEEFCKAAGILGIKSGVGVQLRVHMYGDGRSLNNPYEKDLAFVTIRGIPKKRIKQTHAALAEMRAGRFERDKRMVERFNSRIKKFGISIDFEKDIVAASRYGEGGTITERHILYSFARKITEKLGSASAVVNFLKNDLKINVGEEYSLVLSDEKSPYFTHDLVRCMKNEISFFYLPAAEAIAVEEAVKLAHSNGALITYMYLGKNGNDENEDAYRQQLVKDLAALGFDALEIPVNCENTYELMELCRENGLFALSYLDINSPRLRFAPIFSDRELTRNMWAVVGHERCASENPEDGLNTPKSVEKNPDLEARLNIYAGAGRYSNA